MADDLKYMPAHLIDEAEMENDRDWLSRLLEMIPVGATLDNRCFLGAPWRIDFARRIRYRKSGRPGDAQRALHGAVRNLLRLASEATHRRTGC
jgi:hypothetical protein